MSEKGFTVSFMVKIPFIFNIYFISMEDKNKEKEIKLCMSSELLQLEF